MFPLNYQSGYINQNRIHSNHPKKEGPFFIPQNINYVIKNGQENEAITTNIYGKGTRLKIFIEWEYLVPKMSNQIKNNSQNCNS